MMCLHVKSAFLQSNLFCSIDKAQDEANAITLTAIKCLVNPIFGKQNFQIFLDRRSRCAHACRRVIQQQYFTSAWIQQALFCSTAGTFNLRQGPITHPFTTLPFDSLFPFLKKIEQTSFASLKMFLSFPLLFLSHCIFALFLNSQNNAPTASLEELRITCCFCSNSVLL